MFERISNGWALAKQSYRVLWLDKELLIFPLLSGIATIAVFASFVVPLWRTGMLEEMSNRQPEEVFRDPIVYVTTFAFYFCSYFVITFFNSAIVACAVIRFRGDNPTLADGFAASFSRLPQIFAWALVAATVGMILKLIELRSNRAGQFMSALLGTAWTIATYFVVPILVVERIGPFQAIQRSVRILKDSWGEALVANFGLGLIGFFLVLVAAIPAVGGVLLGGGAAIAGVAISVCLVLLLALVTTAAKAVTLAALYEYAADGRAPEYFDADLLGGAFQGRWT